jgi:hypothetical protein
MRRRSVGAAVGSALFAVAMLLGAAPAYADDAPQPSVTTGAWVVVLGGFVVVVVAGLALAALRKAATRRREQ